jgi:hypothetical protein
MSDPVARVFFMTIETYLLISRPSRSGDLYEPVGDLIRGRESAWQAAEYLQSLGEDVGIIRSTEASETSLALVGRLDGHLPGRVLTQGAQPDA